MKPVEAARILDRIGNGIWPTPVMSETALGVWAEHLAGLDGMLAVNAMRQLELASKWRPTLAEFREAYRSQVRRHESMVRPLPPGPPDVEMCRVAIVEIRAELEARGIPRPAATAVVCRDPDGPHMTSAGTKAARRRRKTP